MKVLVWMTSNFGSNSTSEHLISAIIKALCEQGHTVHVLQKGYVKASPILTEELAGLPVTTDCINVKKVGKSNFVGRYLESLQYVKDTIPYLKKYKDIGAVFLQSTVSCGFAIKAIRKNIRNAKITYNAQDIFPYNAVYSGNIRKGSMIFRCLAFIQRRGYKIADHIITISEDMKDTLVADGTPADKIEVVYNWSYQDEPYDKSKLDMTVPNQLFSKDFFNVVYAGNVGVMQNVDILIEAAALMKDQKDVWFHIIGNGAYKEKLQKKAKELGIENISFWPMQPPEAAPSIYAAADVNVIPLVKDVYRTALPSKTATCLACGQPIIFVIGKDSKFGHEVVCNTGCLLTDSDRPSELVESIRRIKYDFFAARTEDYYIRKFRKSDNCRKYAVIISEHT